VGANWHPGWILGRRREWEKVGERERGKESGREKEEKRMGGKGNGTKKRRGGERRERKWRREGKNFVQL